MGSYTSLSKKITVKRLHLKRNKTYFGLLLIGLIFGLLILRENLKTTPSNDYNNDLLALDETPIIHPSSGLPTPWAVSYSPYTELGNCKSSKTMIKDLNEIASIGTKAIRLFSNDCGILEAVHKVRPQLKLILGLHPHSESGHIDEFKKSLKDQLLEITRCKCWSKIDMLVVGSQGVFADIYTRADLVKMIRYVRKEVNETKDFHGLISTSEPVQSYISSTKYNAISVSEYKKFQKFQNKISNHEFLLSAVEDNDICSVVDVVGLVVQPFFNFADDATGAGKLVSRDVRFAKYLCSDKFIGSAHNQQAAPTTSSEFEEAIDKVEQLSTSKIPPVIVLEAGWPSAGNPNGNAIASPEHQKIALEELVTARDSETNARIPVTLYSYQNELWRDPGPFEVETSFGISGQY